MPESPKVTQNLRFPHFLNPNPKILKFVIVILDQKKFAEESKGNRKLM